MTSTTELSDELKQYIDDNRVFATAATIGPDGQPHGTVVWLGREGNELFYSTCTDRQQGKNLARDPRITIVVNPPDNPYVYAEIRGTVTLTPDPDLELGNQLSVKYTGKPYREFNPDSVNDGPRVTVRITPTKVTGRL